MCFWSTITLTVICSVCGSDGTCYNTERILWPQWSTGTACLSLQGLAHVIQWCGHRMVFEAQIFEAKFAKEIGGKLICMIWDGWENPPQMNHTERQDGSCCKRGDVPGLNRSSTAGMTSSNSHVQWQMIRLKMMKRHRGHKLKLCWWNFRISRFENGVANSSGSIRFFSRLRCALSHAPLLSGPARNAVKLNLGVHFGTLHLLLIGLILKGILRVWEFQILSQRHLESLIWSQTWVTSKVVSDMKGNLFLKEDRFGGECPPDLWSWEGYASSIYPTCKQICPICYAFTDCRAPVGLSEDGDNPRSHMTNKVNLLLLILRSLGVYSTKVSCSCTPDSWEQNTWGQVGAGAGNGHVCANIIDIEARDCVETQPCKYTR